MKILVVSDEESRFIWDFFDPERFRGVELIISCGDLDSRYLSFLATMISAEVVYVRGNHDKIYSRRPPEGCTCIEDTVFTYKGLLIFGLGGVRGPRGPELLEFNERQMAHRIARKRWALRNGVDIFVTHAPAAGLGDRQDEYHRGFETFRAFLDHYQPRLHLYGHVHHYSMQEQIIQYGPTTLVNTCGYRLLEL